MEFKRGFDHTNDTLPSCLVSTPVKVHLSSIRSLLENFKSNAALGKNEPTRLRLITYRCPKDPPRVMTSELASMLDSILGSSTDHDKLNLKFEKNLGDDSH